MTYLNSADILIPKSNIDYTKYSVVACDQYTSQPDYWTRIENFIDDSVSTYNLVFPEIYLETSSFNDKINDINHHMQKYYNEGVFSALTDSMIYVKRTLRNGQIRKGIVATIDLEHYDYKQNSENIIRATEGTVLERIPPRVKIRQNAILELPHIMLLVDDQDNTIFNNIDSQINSLEEVYNFSLMENSGSLCGYKISAELVAEINSSFSSFMDYEQFNKKYNIQDKKPMLFAVGDGNHSLATAKECYEKIKQDLGDKATNHPSRYALVEVVNLHDNSLDFEAIHRVLFDVSSECLLQKLNQKHQLVEGVKDGCQSFTLVLNGQKTTYSLLNTNKNLVVGTLQSFFDEFLYECGGKIDYIHGEDVVEELTLKDSSNVGFILPSMHKSDLFKTVILDGALPRKTFSMGEACDKRFYFEARLLSK